MYICALCTVRAYCCNGCKRKIMRPLFVLLAVTCWWVEHTHTHTQTHTHRAEKYWKTYVKTNKNDMSNKYMIVTHIILMHIYMNEILKIHVDSLKWVSYLIRRRLFNLVKIDQFGLFTHDCPLHPFNMILELSLLSSCTSPSEFSVGVSETL